MRRPLTLLLTAVLLLSPLALSACGPGPIGAIIAALQRDDDDDEKLPAKLEITTTSLPHAINSVAYNATVNAGGGTLPYTWSISAGSPPTGVTIDSGTGVLSGTPADTATGYVFIVQVVDGAAASATKQLTITLYDELQITYTPPLLDATLATPYGPETITTTGGTGNYTWSITAGSLPSGLTLNSSNGQISGTPNDTVTSYPFTVQVQDDAVPAQSDTIDLTLNLYDTLTISTTSLPYAINSVAYNATVNAGGGILPYTWSISAGSPPTGVTIDSGTGLLSGTPADTATDYVFTVQVVDGAAASATKQLTITLYDELQITYTPPLPDAENGQAYGPETIAVTGGTGNTTWSISAGTLPSGVILATTNGQISGTPNDTVGAYPITVMVQDDAVPPQTDTIDLPLTLFDTITITTTSLPYAINGVAYNEALSATGGTGNNTWSESGGPNLPTGLSIVGNTIQGTAADTTGLYNFTLQVDDDGAPAQSDTQPLSIDLYDQLQITTSTTLPTALVGSTYSETLAATGGDGNYTWSNPTSDIPAWLSLNPSTGELSSATVGATGLYTFTVRVTDGLTPAQTDDVLFSLTVVAQPTTIYVATTGNDSTGDGSPGNPFASIQKGLDSASTGTTVIVLDGTYTGTTNKNLDFAGKDIYLKSSGEATACIIDCESAGRAFLFDDSETNSAIVEGFTIQNGGVGNEYGGAIQCDGASPTVKLCVLQNNTADGGGGDGGAIGCKNSSSPIIEKCTITNNAAGYGGGIACFSSSPTITNCDISSNQSTTGNACGGGISCRQNSVSDIVNCLIASNTAGEDGGGIYCADSTATITNCLIIGNDAADGGGLAGANSTSTIIITNCTVTGNSASNVAKGGGGIYCYGAEMVFNNTILWGNTAAASAHQIWSDATSTITLNCCDYSNGAGDIDGTGTVTPNNCIHLDPLFIGGSDYHLQSGSPCIDKGNNSYVTWSEDLDGNSRIQKGIVDIGAYESTYGTAPVEPRWVEKTPTTSPPARRVPAMAYDSARGVMVLFGGYDGTSLLNDTWEYDGNRWWKRNPANRPSARRSHDMVYDSKRKVVVLFGGNHGGTTDDNETWVWDGANWTQKNPANKPFARCHHAMAYDSSREVVVLFGGEISGATRHNDTWEWNGTNWQERSFGTKPGERSYHALAYDPQRGLVVLSHGYMTGSYRNDTWEYDGTQWIERFPANQPTNIADHKMVYDSARDRMVVFGGWGQRDQTWEWNGTDWAQVFPAVKPAGREKFCMAYDSRRQKVALCGGYNGTINFGDTWEYGIFPLEVETNILPDGEVGTAYSALVSANYGTTPYTFSLDTATYNQGCPAGIDLERRRHNNRHPDAAGQVSLSRYGY